MQVRLFLALGLSALLAACGGGGNDSSDNGGTTPPPPPASIITANFDPAQSVIPFPSNLLFSGTTDLTLNIPVADAENGSDPQVALNALDGFSTVAPWSTTFSAPPDPSTLVAGQTVHVYEVTLDGPAGKVTSVVRELNSPDEYVVAPAPSDSTGKTLAIVPTQPLKSLTSYEVVLTNGIADANGSAATVSTTYFLAKGVNPLCVDGHSTSGSLTDEQACQLEPIRQRVNAQENAAQALGVNRDSIVLSWVATTESTTVELQQLTAKTEAGPPAPVQLAPTGLTLADVNPALPPIADVYIGVISIPYYLGVPSQDDPTAPLTDFWHAAPGAYVPPFDGLGLDPESTNVTAYNPFPVATQTVTIPVLLTVPNGASGNTRPAGGWPLVIYQHGITRNRSDMLAVAGTLASQGYAAIAIDLPLHGITDQTSPLYVENTPFAAVASERTFDVDYADNQTGAPGPDGNIDSSGSHFINLSSLLSSRDNLREGVADLVQLEHAIPGISFDGDDTPDFDPGRIEFVGQSLGSIVGTMFVAIDPNVNVGVLNVPGGGIARLLEGSPTFGPQIRAGLQQSAGLMPGTPDYAAFFVAAQTVIDSGDPINYGEQASDDLLLDQEVLGDQVIPNTVEGAPLSGGEPLIAVLGLEPITHSVQSADGIRGVVRFTQGTHGSLLDPTPFPAVTAEMQGEMASMIVSQGHAVQVSETSVIQTD